ncbi:hypothetical protein QE152_g30737 [Popillia japonica]|uniref:Reverse transcriptase domain-containing protein n=1 Tax=Popillia japonica TaxID=7064 RepID=A0AAW1JER8_POPJA
MNSLRDDIKQFWEIEEVNIPNYQKTDNDICEEHFISNVSRASDGRFIVRIPLKFSPMLLGDLREQALSRLAKLEAKLKSSPTLRSEYSSFLQEYYDLGHMSPSINNDDSLPSFILPHHSVLKQDSVTTKLRVVLPQRGGLYGSATTTTGWSLNDLQYTGPSVINDIFKILITVRQYKFLVNADVAKMYRQIWIHPDDRCLQKIFWRNNENEEPRLYTLNTVTYGTSSAPFLAIRCLQQAAYENQHIFPDNIPEMKKNFTSLVNVKQDLFPFHNYSSYTRLKRAIAYCIRFINNLRKPIGQRKLGFLDTNELQNATNVLVKWAQEESFSADIAIIKTNLQLNLKSNLSSLSPFLDNNGLLRVGGRLEHSNSGYTVNHPLLLNGKHHLTKLILEEAHKKLLHVGPHTFKW